MLIVISGASGFVGRAVTAQLRENGHDVRRLVRRAATLPNEISWDPARRALDPAALEGADVVINLAGENIGAGRWTVRRRAAIRSSRINATATLVAAVTQSATRPSVWLNASAIGCYGDRGDEVLTEDSPLGQGFLPEVCRDWETEANRVQASGVRVACLRLGLVLAQEGGALAKMRPVFRLGLGGRLGSGRQWMSWVHRDDVVQVVLRALADDRYAGPINVVAPEAVRNSDFTRALGRAWKRPTALPVPGWALRLAFGDMADATLLASSRVVPAKLSGLGYVFRFGSLESALAAG